MCQTETKPELMTDASGFEIKTCGRCGGCGRYSYCTMHGDRCFGCGGTGKVYTKRGAAAKAFLEESLMVRADEIKVGDTVKTWHGDKFSKVLRVGPQDDGGGAIVNGTLVPGYTIETVRCVYVLCGPADKVRKGWSAEDKAPKLAAALAHRHFRRFADAAIRPNLLVLRVGRLHRPPLDCPNKEASPMIKIVLTDGRVLLYEDLENIRILEEYKSKAWGDKLRLREIHGKASDVLHAPKGRLLVLVVSSGTIPEWRNVEIVEVESASKFGDFTMDRERLKMERARR